jgi:hypothetical protein
MHIILFIIYSVVLCYLITKMTFFRDSRLKPIILVSLFGFRVTTGCLHNWIAWRYIPHHGDIWAFFQESFVTRHELFHDFHAFIADNSALADMPHNFIECMHIVLNFLSFDNLYINTLLFSFVAFAGNIALFRAFNALFKNDMITALSVLVLPSTLFWTSCIHTEGILYMMLGFFGYYLYKAGIGRSKAAGSPPGRSLNLRPLLYSLVFFGLMVFFRSAMAISLLPAIGFWWLAGLFPSRRTLARVTGMTLATIILVLAIPGISAIILHTLSTRQQEFQSLIGNSRLSLPKLDPTWKSFLEVLPTASCNGFFQPLPGSGGQLIYSVFSIELILIWSIVIYALISFSFSKDYPTPASSPSSLRFLATSTGCLLFSLTGMLLIGFIVPFAGAIVRYRSIFLPFLLAPFLHILSKHAVIHRLNCWLTQNLLAGD